MSILDSIMGAVQQHSDVNQEQHSNLVQSALQMFGNHTGLSGLMNSAESQGLGHLVQSWVSTGSNQPIAPQQLESILGEDRISQLASRTGVPPAIASAALSRILPMVVDKLTPQG
ncbi:MAG TPA: YidB family protein, partial [Terriglobales bacterium]|nr:YidB family protein [Terriglobales bacterium]